MFDILVYLYETYYRPDVFPDSIALAKKLSAVGFEDDEIIEALDWLSALAVTTNGLENEALLSTNQKTANRNSGFRIYTEPESLSLGCLAIGFIQCLDAANLLNMQQREILIERAMAIDESPVPLEKMKVITLMMFWSQGTESEIMLFDELLLTSDELANRPIH
jgi:Smg protein